MKRAVLVMAAAAIAMAGCETTGLSMREGPGNSHSEYISALYSNIPAGDARAALPPRPFAPPARVVVAQVGETAPPEAMLKRLKKETSLFATIEVMSAMPETFSRYQPEETGEDATRRHVEAMCLQAQSMNMDYLLLVGGTVESTHSGTPLSILNATIVGLWIVPSQQTRALVKAGGALIDVRSRQVVSSSSAEVEGSDLSPAASQEADELRLFKRLRDDVTVKLAEDVIAHCQKPAAITQTVVR